MVRSQGFEDGQQTVDPLALDVQFRGALESGVLDAQLPGQGHRQVDGEIGQAQGMGQVALVQQLGIAAKAGSPFGVGLLQGGPVLEGAAALTMLHGNPLVQRVVQRLNI